MGFADHLAEVVNRHGRLDFWKLDMRPGKPIGFGTVKGCPILVLPGNPVAAAGGFAILGRSIIQQLRGAPVGKSNLRFPISTAQTKLSGKTYLLLANLLEDAAGKIKVTPLANQSSASYSSLANASVLAILPPEKQIIEAGEQVEVLELWNCPG